MNYLRKRFSTIVSALVYSIIQDINIRSPHGSKNAVVSFVLEQHKRMPRYLGLPLFWLTLLFDLSGYLFFFKPFYTNDLGKRFSLINFLRKSRLGPPRDFIRFFYSLAIIGWADPYVQASVGNEEQLPTKLKSDSGGDMQVRRFDVVVIGGGPGGVVSATLLAEAGFKVCLLEEGKNLSLQSAIPFTAMEMVQKYRNGGLTLAFGNPKITYVEGRCVGGGSEINSGLYHRTPRAILDSWTNKFDLRDVSDEDLVEFFEACEEDLTISKMPPGEIPKASLMLKKGADLLGWECLEIPRWFAYNTDPNDGKSIQGQRQSMTKTYIPRFLKSGGVIVSDIRAVGIKKKSNTWIVKTKSRGSKRVEFGCENVFIAGGAIGTPSLLAKSGLKGVYGNSLQVHPTIKIVALFDEEVNGENMGVPVHQVKEFSSRFSFGCSISSVPYLQLAMLDYPSETSLVDTSWRKMAIYYAMITPSGVGSVKNLPFFSDPLITYTLTKDDLINLSEATRKLSELLFTAGAKKLFPSISGMKPLLQKDDLASIPAVLPRSDINLMTIHLFSSCPMGENRERCTVNSYGKMHGYDGIYISDASILPSAPGVNPQGSIMAFARRNAMNFIKEHGIIKR